MVECPTAVLVALSTAIRRPKRRVVRLCRLLMSGNTGKRGTGCKPCDARQHFIQIDRMANKMQRFVFASIALMRSRRVFLVLVRQLMCEGKRMPWNHTCVNASSMKCRTCKCLIWSPAPLKLNIPRLGRRLRRGCRPTTIAPSEHANS
jgi:hypothetical protein